MELRPYQRRAVDAVYDHLRSKDTNPVICIPTGGGKTPVIATICRDAVRLWSGRVLILAHVKELLEQSYEKLNLIAPVLEVGIVSAGLSRKEYDKQVVVAGIQSSHQYPEKFGHRDLILVDEAHLIPTDGNGMYRRLLNAQQNINPNVRVLGFTATPFRMDSGTICQPDHFLNEICYEIGVKELINQGYLCKLSSKSTETEVNLAGVQIQAGEYVAQQMEQAYMGGDFTLRAIDEMMRRTTGRKSILIFTSGVEHANEVRRLISELYGYHAEVITGDTSAGERADTIRRFREGQLQWLINVNVLTVGFDAPNVDCVVLMRSTLSPGLYYQMLGRGFRIADGKENCLVLDFGGNIKRHGCVDQLRIKLPGVSTGAPPVKICPECREVVACGVERCECGYEWPKKEVPREPKVRPEAAPAAPVSGEIEDVTYDVKDIHYAVHTKRNADLGAPKTLRVDYKISMFEKRSEWVCIEHDGFAGQKARKWWQLRSNDPFPKSAADAVVVAEAGGLAVTKKITVRFTSGEQFPQIIDYELGPVPEYVGEETFDEDNVPW